MKFSRLPNWIVAASAVTPLSADAALRETFTPTDGNGITNSTNSECTIQVAILEMIEEGSELDEFQFDCEMDPADAGGKVGQIRHIAGSLGQKKILKKMLDDQHIVSGVSRLQLGGVGIVTDASELVLGSWVDPTSLVTKERGGKKGKGSSSGRRLATVTGDKPMLVVRVTDANHLAISEDAAGVGDSIFGTATSTSSPTNEPISSPTNNPTSSPMNQPGHSSSSPSSSWSSKGGKSGDGTISTSSPTNEPISSPTNEPTTSPTSQPGHSSSGPSSSWSSKGGKSGDGAASTFSPTNEPTSSPINEPTSSPANQPSHSSSSPSFSWSSKGGKSGDGVTPSPTTKPTVNCVDDSTWQFQKPNGNLRGCSFVAKKAENRCSRDGFEDPRNAMEACPVACNNCASSSLFN